MSVARVHAEGEGSPWLLGLVVYSVLATVGLASLFAWSGGWQVATPAPAGSSGAVAASDAPRGGLSGSQQAATTGPVERVVLKPVEEPGKK